MAAISCGRLRFDFDFRYAAGVPCDLKVDPKFHIAAAIRRSRNFLKMRGVSGSYKCRFAYA